MDLNAAPPAMWNYPEGPYELADHCLSQNANTLILLNAWLDSGKDENDDHDWHTINFWAARLRPLWVNSATLNNPTGDLDDPQGTTLNTNGDAQDNALVRVVICNRTGIENSKDRVCTH
jgi:protein N-terminal amidase